MRIGCGGFVRDTFDVDESDDADDDEDCCCGTEWFDFTSKSIENMLISSDHHMTSLYEFSWEANWNLSEPVSLFERQEKKHEVLMGNINVFCF